MGTRPRDPNIKKINRSDFQNLTTKEQTFVDNYRKRFYNLFKLLFQRKK
jgi:hypothetical protein